jgi:hypothetical protein
MIKESQVMSALFLPGYPELERQLQRAGMQFQQPETGGRSFQERRQRTMTSMQEAGLANMRLRTYLVECQAPLEASARDYIQQVVFEHNWGETVATCRMWY